MKADHRSEAAKAYRCLYNTAQWKRLRLQGLSDQPLCVMCKAAGKVTAATVRDHKIPHRGDLALFWDIKNHQSMCAACHSSDSQMAETSGRVRIGVDKDGWPLEQDAGIAAMLRAKRT